MLLHELLKACLILQLSCNFLILCFEFKEAVLDFQVKSFVRIHQIEIPTSNGKVDQKFPVRNWTFQFPRTHLHCANVLRRSLGDYGSVGRGVFLKLEGPRLNSSFLRSNNDVPQGKALNLKLQLILSLSCFVPSPCLVFFLYVYFLLFTPQATQNMNSLPIAAKENDPCDARFIFPTQ